MIDYLQSGDLKLKYPWTRITLECGPYNDRILFYEDIEGAGIEICCGTLTVSRGSGKSVVNMCIRNIELLRVNL